MVKERERTCTFCGHNGHNSRTCIEKGCVKLFGVNISVPGERDDAQPARQKKKARPWTEIEHQQFLAALKKVGKGYWKKISTEYVTTRTASQVASHAQKFFLRQALTDKKNRRTSLFDMPPLEISVTEEKSISNASTSSEQTVNKLPSPPSSPLTPMASIQQYGGIPYMGTSNVPSPSYVEAVKYYQISAYFFKCKSYQNLNSFRPSSLSLLHQSTFQAASSSSNGNDDDFLELKIGLPQSPNKD